MPSFLGPSGKSFHPGPGRGAYAGRQSYLGARGTFYPRATASPTARTFQSNNRTFFEAGTGTTPPATRPTPALARGEPTGRLKDEKK